MRIGHFIPDPAGVGGLERYVSRLVDAQSSAGHEVCLLAGVQGLAGAAIQGVQVLHAHGLLPQGVTQVPLVRHVHGHWPYCPSGSRFLGLRDSACNRAYSPVGCLWGHVFDRCGSVRPREMTGNFRRVREERRMLSRVRAIAVSQFVRTQMVRSGYPDSQIDVVLLPAPASQPAPPAEGTPRFVFVGRLVRHKGCHWMLHAVAQAGVRCEIDIAGDGPERPRLERLACRLGLGGCTCFHGWVGENEVLRLMHASRAVIFPSLWPEPAGLVTLESAAAGRAAIVSRIGGIPEYAEACGHAVCVEPGDVLALAQAIRHLSHQPEHAAKLGQTGAEAAQQRFSMQNHLLELEACYRRTLNEGTCA
ncbi:MAG: glycosyltransferase family 4 protein [Phycisphaerae bacterium]|nr:glycosyltransferase family 4 protein [Phycisphaerae bacterium]MDW8261553.1 glycosyltransferase family 4 protein [Phycisphaerales bacterium]